MFPAETEEFDRWARDQRRAEYWGFVFERSEVMGLNARLLQVAALHTYDYNIWFSQQQEKENAHGEQRG